MNPAIIIAQLLLISDCRTLLDQIVQLPRPQSAIEAIEQWFRSLRMQDRRLLYADGSNMRRHATFGQLRMVDESVRWCTAMYRQVLASECSDHVDCGAEVNVVCVALRR